MKSLLIDETSPDAQLEQAGVRLSNGGGDVVLSGVATLRPGRLEIRCEIAAPDSAAARCEEEYKVLVENAARALRSSRLGAHLPGWRLQWVVVDRAGDDAVELWREP